MDIIHLLKQSEGKTLEFKRDLSSPMGVMRTVVAFANTAGGTIVLGIEDQNRHICGIEEPLLHEEKLANLISDLVTPQLLPEIEVIPWRNSYLLAIQIFPSPTRPHYLKKQKEGESIAYIRVGSTNRIADDIMLAELRRVRIKDSFDKTALPNVSADDIDIQAITELFSPFRNLKKLDLMSMDLLTIYQEKKVPTAGGCILFGKHRLDHFPDAWIQVGRFSGTTKTHIRDTQEIKCYPVLAIKEAMDFVKKHAMHGIEIKDVQHTDTWNLPMVAIREAIINAVVHADYTQIGAPIRLAFFDDRIEIENPGLLLFGLTIDEIKRGISKLRNRVIGQVFYRLGLIERWGSGIKRIADACEELGFSEPIFEEIGTHFRVTISTVKNQKTKLDKTHQNILDALEQSDGLSTKEIANIINSSTRAARSRLISLIEKGLIVTVGKSMNDPQRKYFIKK